MECNIYGTIYTIKELKQDEFYNNIDELCKDVEKNYFDNVEMGRHLGIKQEILLNKDLNKNQKLRTLAHEIVHAIGYTLAYNLTKLNEEDLCEFVSVHYGLIYIIVTEYELYDSI